MVVELRSSRSEDAPPEVSVLVVGYKSLSYIERCLAGAIRSAQNDAFEFLFIDCSDDGSEAFVRERFPQVRVLPFQGNLGFAKGNNVLAEHARGRRLLLLNPDAFAAGNELPALLAVARAHPDAGAWGGITMLPSGEVDGGSIQAMPGALPLVLELIGLARLSPGAANPRSLRAQSVPVLSGAFMMVDAVLWRSLRGLDERFFMYTEEVDLCRRIAYAGKTLIIDPRIRMIHDSGSGTKRTPARLVNRARGDATFYAKHYAPLHCTLCKLLLWTHALTRQLYGRLRRREDYVQSFGAIAREPSAWWNGWPEARAATPTHETSHETSHD